ncbi:putative peptidoglycan lipid II flippase [Acetomicrobium flavidum]|uniref:Peptidoglycan lipid II flippase n=1 Tax=Acetomicrobium flavidum TaxID=49896 RepID=A0ABY1JFI7_9BACT|nr:putative peptidoglycan lipid II flippase [Acetomicrobium flavidum]
MFRAFLVLSSGSVIGKLIGFLREILMAALFGTGTYVAAYRVAQTATLMPIEFFLTNSLEAGFVPLYVRYAKEDPKRARAFLTVTVMLFLLLAGIIFLFLYLGSSWWVKILAPGMDDTTKALTASMLHVMALAVPLYILGMLMAYLEMAHGRYLTVSLRSTIQSVGLISGSLLAIYFKNPLFLAWGFVFAYLFYLLWLLSGLRKFGSLHFRTAFSQNVARDVFTTFWRYVRPVLIIPFLIQGNIAVERIVASLIGSAAIPAVDYAKFITESGVILIAAPLGMVGLSTMSGLDSNLVRQKVGQIANIVLIFMIPVSIFLACNNIDIVHILYARGAFDQESVEVTSKILLGFSIGMWAQVLSYYFIRVLNSQLRNTEVLIYTSISILIDVGIKLLFYKNLGPMVLGLGLSVNSIVLCLFITYALNLYKELKDTFLSLAVGSLFYIVAYIFISQKLTGLSHIVHFITITSISCLYWIFYVLLQPRLRKYVYLLIGNLHNLL